jgi:hypothetical protein
MASKRKTFAEITKDLKRERKAVIFTVEEFHLYTPNFDYPDKMRDCVGVRYLASSHEKAQEYIDRQTKEEDVEYEIREWAVDDGELT